MAQSISASNHESNDLLSNTVCNIIFGIGFACAEILSTAKISQAHLVLKWTIYCNTITIIEIQINITP